MMKTSEQILSYCKKKGYSIEYANYWAQHLFCEICGYHADPPHHIRTRGAGGSDETSNLLSLCTAHHTEAHTIGVTSFANKYEKFWEKILTALDIEFPEW